MIDTKDRILKRKRMALIETLTTSPIVKSFLAGSFSGTCSTILFQPLDLVKTRIQSTIHIEPRKILDRIGRQVGVAALGNRESLQSHWLISRATNAGMIAIVGRVVRNEHIFGLWKGMTPSMVRCVPGVGLYFSSLHWLKSYFCEGPPGPFQAVALGVMARTFTGVAMIPITVVKTRYESEMYSYKGVVEAVKIIYSKEGLKGLSCGLLPTLLRDAPFSGLYLMFYTQTKKVVPQNLFDGGLSPPVHFACGVTAGILASGVTQPFDVLKTKMQLYPDKFDNIFQAAIYVRKKYGLKGYFKGLVPRMIRRTLMAAMAWTVYEQMMKSFGIK